MPYSGYDPYGGLPTGGAIDMSGGGMDPSYYYSLAPGGAFPGDTQNLLEYLAAHSTGRDQGNPDYQLPAWLSRLVNIVPGRAGNMLSRAASAHERNVQSPGSGQQPSDPSSGYPYQTFSGPGAPYGPADGPGTGLIDYGRPVGQNWDAPEFRPPGMSTSGPTGGGGRGGGGHQAQSFNFQPYQGIGFQSSFVGANQPIAPFSQGPFSPTQMVPGNRSPVAPPPGAAGRTPGFPGSGGRGGAGGGAGTGSGQGARGGNGGAGTGAGRGPGQGGPARPGSPPLPPSNNPSAPGPGDPWSPGSFGMHLGELLRANTFGGVDTNALERGTPGWRDDPTTGIFSTAGFPSATLPAPQSGENFESYLTRLHDTGLTNDDIASSLGRYGFSPNSGGDWDFGWGTGPVVRGDNGYSFANNSGSGMTASDRNGHGLTLDFGGGGGAGRSNNPEQTLSTLLAGWTPTRY